ncbi:hypothetical protein [Candidatus Palauibacter sp.]|uniref:hypothetical protein n=1 Tax=Candidatus Palauibacter sp. TaxID=3101350 RepID=UPI003AF1F480
MVLHRRPAHQVARAAARATILGASLAACGGAGARSDPAVSPRPEAREFTYRVGYHVSCSVSDECRVQYLDETGVLRARDIVGEWELDFGADPGERLWVRAGAGGCPPRPVRVEVRMGGQVVAEHLAPSPRGSRCSWILAETEFRIP